jgi:alkylhydroperoxidase family enzyme
MSRVAPLAPPWSEDDAAGITSWGHPDRTYEPLLLVRCLQRHPALAAKLRTLGEALYVDTKLPPRVRTIAILRICALLGCAYEWGGQAAFWGPIAKVSDAECDALVTGAESPWSDDERVLIGAVDELERTGSWSSDTWNALGHSFSDEQRMELLIAVGWYRTICTLCNGLDLSVEGWMRPWPSAA